MGISIDADSEPLKFGFDASVVFATLSTLDLLIHWIIWISKHPIDFFVSQTRNLITDFAKHNHNRFIIFREKYAQLGNFSKLG